MKSTKIYRGTIVYAPQLGALECLEHAYLVAQNGMIAGVFQELPGKYQDAALEDFGDCLLIPSFTDLHLHAPQYAMMGMGFDLPLLEWLNTYTFKEEARFADAGFARTVYEALAAELVRRGTTRVCMFSSLHREGTLILMDALERAGITGFVGKVNMDRNSPDCLRETCEESLAQTRRWLDECAGRYAHIRPILTPRFTPSCSDALMEGLGRLAEEYELPVQSHLSENDAEIEWVRTLHPDCEQYWETYAKFGLWKRGTIMAHCVHSDVRERAAMRSAAVWVAHSPDSNTNLYSGVAPVRKMLNEGLSVALASDVAGGAKLSMLHAAAEAIRASKLRYYYSGKRPDEAYLTVPEAFYLATSAGQQYFGAGPGFCVGDSLHAIVLDDSALPPSRPLAPAERLERLIYADDSRTIRAVISEGRRLV